LLPHRCTKRFISQTHFVNFKVLLNFLATAKDLLTILATAKVLPTILATDKVVLNILAIGVHGFCGASLSRFGVMDNGASIRRPS
jgi:hypothetical protein